MNGMPNVVIRAKEGTNLEGKLSLAEAAGIKALFSEIKGVQHERRKLILEDQKQSVVEEDLVESLNAAWKELATAHNFDPNVPIASWTLSKKNRATLDPSCHPKPTKKTKPTLVEDVTKKEAAEAETSDEPVPEKKPTKKD